MNVAKKARKRELPVVLLTGFDPFGGESVNPSWEAVRQLDGKIVRGHRIVALQLPTEFARSRRALRAALARHRPALALCVGQAGGRANVSLERVAINLIDARIPDNAGRQPIDVRIVDKAPSAYFSTLPLKAMLLALRRHGMPAEISHSAGTFVCNHVFYDLMHALKRQRGARGGFVHVPFTPQQAAHHPGAPSLAEEIVVNALRVMIDTALRTKRDRRVAAGSIA